MKYYHVKTENNIFTTRTTRTGKRVAHQLIGNELITEAKAKELPTRILENYCQLINIKPSDVYRSFGVRFLKTGAHFKTV